MSLYCVLRKFLDILIMYYTMFESHRARSRHASDTYTGYRAGSEYADITHLSYRAGSQHPGVTYLSYRADSRHPCVLTGLALGALVLIT